MCPPYVLNKCHETPQILSNCRIYIGSALSLVVIFAKALFLEEKSFGNPLSYKTNFIDIVFCDIIRGEEKINVHMAIV